MEEIADAVERVMVMSDGHLVCNGTRDEVFSKIDLLQKIGLNVPQICLVIEHFKRKGYTFPDNVYNAEKAADAFYDILKGAKNA